MRIALIRQRYNPFGGAERFVDRAVKALLAQGTEVSVIAREWSSESADGAARVIACNPFHLGRRWRDASFARAACAITARGGFDLVQSHERLACCDVYRAGDGVHRQWLAHRARLRGGFANAITSLDAYHRYLLNAERRMFEGERLRAVICNSRMVRADIERYFRIDAAKLHVIYNGVDLDAFSPERARAAAQPLRAQLGIARDEMVFLFVGSGFERKGVDRLLEAFARAKIDGARVLVVGADKTLEAMRARAARLGIGAQVVFTGGQREVVGYYGLADCFVLPTLYDPMPNAALEALACAVPVITTMQCGAAELIEAGKNGEVCDALDLAALTEALRRAATNLRTSAARSAARAAVAGLSIDAMAERLVGLYRALLATQAGPVAAPASAGVRAN